MVRHSRQPLSELYPKSHWEHRAPLQKPCVLFAWHTHSPVELHTPPPPHDVGKHDATHCAPKKCSMHVPHPFALSQKPFDALFVQTHRPSVSAQDPWPLHFENGHSKRQVGPQYPATHEEQFDPAQYPTVSSTAHLLHCDPAHLPTHKQLPFASH